MRKGGRKGWGGWKRNGRGREMCEAEKCKLRGGNRKEKLKKDVTEI